MQEGTVEEALARAAAVGVTVVVQVGCDIKGSRWAAQTAADHDAVHAAVALHPNEAPRIVLGDPDGWSRQGRARAAVTVRSTTRSSRSTRSQPCRRCARSARPDSTTTARP